MPGAPAREPLRRFNLFRSRDLDEAREQVGRVFCPHRLTIAREPRRFDAVQNHVDTGRLSLSYIDYGADVEIEPGELGSFYLIQIPLSGSAAIRSGRKAFTTHAGCVSVLNPNRHTAMTWKAGCRKLQVQIRTSALSDFASSYLGRDLGSVLTFDPAMTLDRPEAGDWVRAVKAYACFIDRVGTGPDSEDLRAYYADAILRGLIETQSHSHSHFMTTEVPGPMPRHVKAALDYIRAHAAEPLTSAAIAQASGVAGRTLQLGFKSFLGTSPMRVLREERLDRCRLELAFGDGRTVREIARKWGFDHPGRFAQYYKVRFGESPKATGSA